MRGANPDRHEWLALQTSLDIAVHDWEFRDVTAHLGALRPGQRFTSGEIQAWLAGQGVPEALAKVDPERLHAYADKLRQLELEKRAHRFVAAAARKDLAGVMESLEGEPATDRAGLDATVRRLSDGGIEAHLALAFGSHESTTGAVRGLVRDLPPPAPDTLDRADYEGSIAALSERAAQVMARWRTQGASPRVAREMKELNDALTSFRRLLQNSARLGPNLSESERELLLRENAELRERLVGYGVAYPEEN